jgi:hypothetical protein
MKQEIGRRGFLRGMLGGLGALVVARAGWLFPEGQPILARARQVDDPSSREQNGPLGQEMALGELYAGFLLLPTPSAFLPMSIQFARGISLHGGIDPSLEGETLKLSSPEELVASLPFPLFVLGEVPHGLELKDASIIRYKQSRSIWAATITYGAYDDLGTLDRRITLVAQTEYAKPHPVWPVRDPQFQPTAEDPEEHYVPPEKVSFVSVGLAVLLPSADGHILQWIQRNILYTLVAEHDRARSAIDTLVESLVRI